MNFKKTISFEFGDVELFENYLVTIMKQGITVIPAYNDKLVAIANSHFLGRPFVYITNRKNSYAVDPSIYYETAKIANLSAFAVVSKDAIAEKTVAVEKMFFNKPFQLFTEMENAIAWALETIKVQKKA
jgi:hypothetical protein